MGHCRTCVAVIALVASTAGADQPEASADLLRDFEGWWDAAKAYWPDSPVYVAWAEHIHPDPALSESDLRAMAARVEGRPDHPEREVLENERRRRGSGPDIVRYEAWIGGPASVRFNRTDTWRPFFVDVGIDGRTQWSLTSTHLAIVDSRAAPSMRDFGVFADDVQRMLRQLVWCGFGSRVKPQGATAHGDHATLVAGAADLSDVEWRGRLDKSTGRFLADESRVVASSIAPDRVGASTRFGDWVYSAALGEWISQRVESRDPEGRLVKALELTELRPLDEQELASVLAIPDVSEPDPVRGEPTFTTIMDHRPGIAKASVVQDGAVVGERPLGEPAGGLNRSTRTLTWIAAGVIVATLVVLRLRRAA
jgi:hypothetical protein